MDNPKVEDVQGTVQVEMAAERQGEKSDVAALKLDKYGFPLVPQPLEHKMDPLDWSTWLKMAIIVQISTISFLSLLAASLIVTPLICQNFYLWLLLLSLFLHRSLV
jgi:hypothetical protein